MKLNKSIRVISGDRIFSLINIAVLSLLTIIIIFPVWNVVVNSLCSGKAIAEGRSIFWPTELSFENYKIVLHDTTIWSAFMISILKTVVGVVCHVLFCSMVAYGMSKTYLKGRKLYSVIGVPIQNEDGTWYDRDMDSDYLTWIKTFNNAYRQGLISDDRFADDYTAHEEKVKSGQYATIMIGGTPQRSGTLQVWMNSNPDAAYIAIDGPQSTVGHAPTLSQAGISGWASNYISKDCKDPIKAIELFTYLLSDEAGVLTTYGVEGETYKVNDAGKYELLPEVKDMQQSDNDKFKKVYRLGEFCLFGHDRYKALGADQIESIKQMQEWGTGKLKTMFAIENIDPDAGTAEARNLSAILTNWNTTLVGMMRAKDDADFDKILNDFKKFRDDNNWDNIVKVRNEKMARNREKLGLN
ncbi:MAG TPA: hypothetical protein VN258_04720 [Mobilitalea sp.]|nr:hypothetical protein [Mobilitalea sp.]